jgi:hypothetical protein
MEETLRIIKFPDIIEFNTLKLDVFEWLKIEDLEMELIEFQNSIWARKFSDLRIIVDKMEGDRLESGVVHNYENQIVKLWTELPETFSSIKKISLSLLTIFSSTYLCETLFSSLNDIKTDKRNRLADEICNSCLTLKCTQYEPQISNLIEEIQHQKSH